MRRIFTKLRSKCGESLIETVCSILVFTLSSIILLSMISTAVQINDTVKKEESAISSELKVAEMQSSGSEEGNIIIKYGKEIQVPVKFYSLQKSGTLYSFKAK